MPIPTTVLYPGLLLSLLLPLSSPAAENPSPIGPLPPVAANPDNPPSEARIALGRTLFFDNRISRSGSMNCATCHIPSLGWTVPTTFSPAFPGQAERRNSPTLLNVGHNQTLIWDGRAPILEKQALGSTKNPIHKNQDIEHLMGIYREDPEMMRMFRAAYDSEPNPGDYGRALAVFQRHVIVTGESAFDRHSKGDESAMSDSAIRGMALFQDKAGCIACHNGPNFTDYDFHNIGLGHNPALDDEAHQAMLRFDAKRMKVGNWEEIKEDPGRYLVTHKENDWGRFKTPTLRNLADTGPYMHDGRYTTLEQVIAHYDRGGDNARNQDPRIHPLNLSPRDREDLKAFLQALRGELPDVRMADWVTPATPTQDGTPDGKQLFEGKASCVNCHQADGQGIANAFPPLAGNPRVTAGDGTYVIATILHGRSGPLTIDGKTFDSTMPSIGTLNGLSDEEIAAVADYVRNAWGNQAKGKVTARQVRALR